MKDIIQKVYIDFGGCIFENYTIKLGKKVKGEKVAEILVYGTLSTLGLFNENHELILEFVGYKYVLHY